MAKINQQELAALTDHQKETRNDLVFSYKTLRNLIGFGGMLLPVILALYTIRETGDKLLQPSISDYYYTSNGDIFVVILSVISVLLFTYNGYSWKEKIWTVIAALCGLGVAFFPTDANSTGFAQSIHPPHTGGSAVFGLKLHFVFAIIFFISLSVMSLYYFPMSDKKLTGNPKGKWSQKEKRNLVYKICGWTMVGCIAILALYMIITPFKNAVGDFPMIFTFEAIAVEAFAISWLTKGETFFPDSEHYIVSTYKEIKSSF